METFPTGTATVFARCISAAIRARLSAERKTQRDLARLVGATAHNYWSTRLRDEKPFTLDDLEIICNAWGLETEEFISAAYEAHADWVYMELERARLSEPSGRTALAIAADEQDEPIVGEHGVEEHP